MQYFLGFSGFSGEPPSMPHCLQSSANGLGMEGINAINEKIAALSCHIKAKRETGTEKQDRDDTGAPEDIAYSTDLTVREKSEELIDQLYSPRSTVPTAKWHAKAIIKRHKRRTNQKEQSGKPSAASCVF